MQAHHVLHGERQYGELFRVHASGRGIPKGLTAPHAYDQQHAAHTCQLGPAQHARRQSLAHPSGTPATHRAPARVPTYTLTISSRQAGRSQRDLLASAGPCHSPGNPPPQDTGAAAAAMAGQPCVYRVRDVGSTADRSRYLSPTRHSTQLQAGGANCARSAHSN